ncbi:hypothetical protein ACRYCC_27560 [Actinomadura scrupuli]|uniref:hypothetical protein n=1 Tax=Actinomadura scrupuli TaxID=559629 RepID=UPI003D96AB06
MVPASAASISIGNARISPSSVVIHPTGFSPAEFSGRVDGDVRKLSAVLIEPGGIKESLTLSTESWGGWVTWKAWNVEQWPGGRLGRWQIQLTAYGPGSTKVTKTVGAYYVRLQTRVRGFNAAPEPVRRGAYLTVSGTLQKLRAYGARAVYEAAPGRRVAIYFKPKGATAYKYVTATTSGRSGAFSKRIKASKDGTWQARFTNTSTLASVVSAADYLDVR